jgi:hypothetical protein
MAKPRTTFFTLPLELRQKIYLLATELKEVKARAKDPELNWLKNKEPATGASTFGFHLWRTYAIRDLGDHPSILLTELVCGTDLVLRTLGALLLLEECRPDLVFVAKQTLEDVKSLKEPYGANANRATCPLRSSSTKPVRVEFLMKLMTQLLKSVVEALEMEVRIPKSTLFDGNRAEFLRPEDWNAVSNGGVLDIGSMSTNLKKVNCTKAVGLQNGRE